ncbi:alkaline phosphatase family protein [Vibrio lentus]|nr:alkaline phosphatase family protein [Vibrio lentus]
MSTTSVKVVFGNLMDDGTYYTNANYQHGNTETIVGHVSLATGAPPSVALAQ